MLDIKTIYTLSSYEEKDGTPRSASAVITTKLPPSKAKGDVLSSQLCSQKING